MLLIVLVLLRSQVDLVGAIRSYGSRTYAQTNDPDSHPDSLAGDARQLDDLRKAATVSSSSPSSGWPSGSVEQIILCVHEEHVKRF